jgi:hypothetical protein
MNYVRGAKNKPKQKRRRDRASVRATGNADRGGA